MTGFCAAFEGLLDYEPVSVCVILCTIGYEGLTSGIVPVIPCRSLRDDEMRYTIVHLNAVGSASLSEPSGDVDVCPLASKGACSSYHQVLEDGLALICWRCCEWHVDNA
jgi:hypothetical protein